MVERHPVARRVRGLPGRGDRRARAPAGPPRRRERRDRRRLRARTGWRARSRSPARAWRSRCSRPRTTIGGGTRTQRADRARPAARPLLGGAPDGGRLAVPATRSSSSGTASSGAGPRSTSPTRSTTAAPACMLRSIDETAAGLGADGRAWRRLFGAPARALRAARSRTSCGRCSHVPRHPLRLPRFGLPAALPATRARARACDDAAGPGAVRRRRRPRVQPAEPADELVGRAWR